MLSQEGLGFSPLSLNVVQGICEQTQRCQEMCVCKLGWAGLAGLRSFAVELQRVCNKGVGQRASCGPISKHLVAEYPKPNMFKTLNPQPQISLRFRGLRVWGFRVGERPTCGWTVSSKTTLKTQQKA